MFIYSKVKRSACKVFTRIYKRLNLPAWLTSVVTQLLHTSHVAQFIDNQYFIEDPHNSFILVKNSTTLTMKSLTVLEGQGSATAVLELIKGLAVS